MIQALQSSALFRQPTANADGTIEQPNDSGQVEDVQREQVTLSQPDTATKAANSHPNCLPINKFEKGYRIFNAACIQLVLGDGPAVLTMAANTIALPPAVAPFLNVINAVNAATGYIGIAADLRVNYDAMKNPNATKIDRIVDWGHFVIGDLVNTGASMVPLFTTLANPVAYGVFMGGQAVGMLFDAGKLMYDIKREGQQSALPDAKSPKRLILDRVEKTFGTLSQTLGFFSLETMVLPKMSFGLPMMIAQPLATIGGAFGFVGALNQIKKSNDLKKHYEHEKHHGVTQTEFPVLTRNKGLQMKPMSVDEAIKSAKRNYWMGVAQAGSSGLMMAAGVTAMHGLAVASLVAAGATAVTGIALHLISKRDEIAKAAA